MHSHCGQEHALSFMVSEGACGSYQLLEATLLALGCEDLVQLVSVQECSVWHTQDACGTRCNFAEVTATELLRTGM